MKEIRHKKKIIWNRCLSLFCIICLLFCTLIPCSLPSHAAEKNTFSLTLQNYDQTEWCTIPFSREGQLFLVNGIQTTAIGNSSEATVFTEQIQNNGGSYTIPAKTYDSNTKKWSTENVTLTFHLKEDATTFDYAVDTDGTTYHSFFVDYSAETHIVYAIKDPSRTHYEFQDFYPLKTSESNLIVQQATTMIARFAPIHLMETQINFAYPKDGTAAATISQESAFSNDVWTEVVLPESDLQGNSLAEFEPKLTNRKDSNQCTYATEWKGFDEKVYAKIVKNGTNYVLQYLPCETFLKLCEENGEQRTEDTTTNHVKIPLTITYQMPSSANQITIRYYKQNAENDEYTEDESARVELSVQSHYLSLKNKHPDLVKTFPGFHLNAASQAKVESTTAVKQEDGTYCIELYYDREEYFLQYHTDGGTYVENIRLRYGSLLTDTMTNPEIERKGYQLSRWEYRYQDEETKQNVTTKTPPAQMPIGGITATAIWQTAQTTYRVAFWVENANDSRYTNVFTETVEAEIGITINLEDQATQTQIQAMFKEHDLYRGIASTKLDIVTNDTTYTTKNTYEYEHYTYQGNRKITRDQTTRKITENKDPVTSYTIRDDGSTVIHIYYTRNYYTLVFKPNVMDSNGKSYIFNDSTTSKEWTNHELSSFVYNGKNFNRRLYTEDDPVITIQEKKYSYASLNDANLVQKMYTITEKYGARIEHLWPVTGNVSTIKATNETTNATHTYKMLSWGTNFYSGFYYQSKWVPEHPSVPNVYGQPNIEGFKEKLSADMVIDSQSPTELNDNGAITDYGAVHSLVAYWNFQNVSKKTYHYILESESGTPFSGWINDDNKDNYARGFDASTYDYASNLKISYQKDASKTLEIETTASASNISPMTLPNYTAVHGYYEGDNIYVFYVKNRHTVTYKHYNDRLSDYRKEIAAGETLPNYNPTEAYHTQGKDWTFGGWYYDDSYQNAYNSASPVTSDLVLYELCLPPTYTLTYVVEDGTFPATETAANVKTTLEGQLQQAGWENVTLNVSIQETNPAYANHETMTISGIPEGISGALLKITDPAHTLGTNYRFDGWTHTVSLSNADGTNTTVDTDFVFDNYRVYKDEVFYANWATEVGYTTYHLIEKQAYETYNSAHNYLTKEINGIQYLVILEIDNKDKKYDYHATITEKAVNLQVEKNGETILFLPDRSIKSGQIGTADEQGVVLNQDSNNNYIAFFYEHVTDAISYEVHYRYYTSETNYITLHASERHEITVQNSEQRMLSIRAKAIPGYGPDTWTKTLELSRELEGNQVIFRYYANTVSADYNIYYSIMDENGNYSNRLDIRFSDQAAVGKFLYPEEYAYRYAQYLENSASITYEEVNGAQITLTNQEAKAYLEQHLRGHILDTARSDRYTIVTRSQNAGNESTNTNEKNVLHIYMENGTYQLTYDLNVAEGDTFYWPGAGQTTLTGIENETGVCTQYQTAACVYPSCPSPEELPPMEEAMQPKRKGYTFLGWSKDQKASSKTECLTTEQIAAYYQKGALYENVTLYAIWAKQDDTEPQWFLQTDQSAIHLSYQGNIKRWNSERLSYDTKQTASWTLDPKTIQIQNHSSQDGYVEDTIEFDTDYEAFAKYLGISEISDVLAMEKSVPCNLTARGEPTEAFAETRIGTYTIRLYESESKTSPCDTVEIPIYASVTLDTQLHTYDVRVEQKELQFTFLPATQIWNPETMTYETEVGATNRWRCDSAVSGVTITNRSDLPITIETSFEETNAPFKTTDGSENKTETTQFTILEATNAGKVEKIIPVEAKEGSEITEAATYHLQIKMKKQE